MSDATHELTPTGKSLDLEFLQKPHEHDPRRVYSTTSTDWQSRVDFDRMRKDRLERARQTLLEKHDLGAVVCFAGENVRYITERLPGRLEEQHIHPLLRAAARAASPVLFETAGLRPGMREDRRALAQRCIRPAITWKWSETAETMMADHMARRPRRAQGQRGREGADRIDMVDPSAAAAFNGPV